MATKTYSEKLKDPRWQKKRLKILERDNWECSICRNSEDTLHVHHVKYYGQPWDAPDKYLRTLCACCHEVQSEINLETALDLFRDEGICESEIYTLIERVKYLIYKSENPLGAYKEFIAGLPCPFTDAVRIALAEIEKKRNA